MGRNTTYSHRIIPVWAATVGALIDERAEVRAYCSPCGAETTADLRAIARKLGPGFSLVDRHPRCRTPGCTGRVFFRAARPGANVWPVKLESRI